MIRRERPRAVDLAQQPDLVSGQLKLAKADIPADSQFFGKPLEATAMIAEMRNLIGHA